jgi:hypothetical protein
VPHPAVVRVISPERDGMSLGTGTLVDVRGPYALVVTNWHVVRDAAQQVSVAFPDGFRSTAYILKVDRDWDLAALAIWRPNVAPVPVARDAPRLGERLTIAGYGQGDYRAQQGTCSQFMSPGVNMPHDIIELSAEARQGDSGGPIFNDRGELSGVLFGSVTGATSGSHARRLRWFLQSIVPDHELGRSDQTLVAQVASPATTAPGDSTQPVTLPAAVSGAHAGADPFLPAAVAPSANGPSGVSAQLVSSAATHPDQALPTVVGAYPAENVALAAPSTTAGFDWRTLVGTSAIEQIKAALALVGALVLTTRGMRWFVHSTQTDKKGKRESRLPPSDG